MIILHFVRQGTRYASLGPQHAPTLRIANKYLVDALHRYLVQKVKDDWPLTLEGWDRRETEIEVVRYAKSTSGA